jgi:hypothetical protein
MGDLAKLLLLDLPRFRLAKWAWTLVGLVLAGLTWPLMFETAKVQVAHLGSAPGTDVAGSFARAVAENPIRGFLLWLCLLLLVTYLGRPHLGPRNVKFLWGALDMTLPDVTLEAEKARKEAEADRDAALESINDLASVIAVLTPLADRREPRDVKTALDLISEMGGRAVMPRERGAQVSIWVHDKSVNELKIKSGYKVSRKTTETFRLKPGEGFAGRVFQENRPMIIPDVAQAADEEFKRNPAEPSNIETIMGIPLYADSSSTTPVGVMCFSHRGKAENRFKLSDRARAYPSELLASLVLTITTKMQITFP